MSSKPTPMLTIQEFEAVLGPNGLNWIPYHTDDLLTLSWAYNEFKCKLETQRDRVLPDNLILDGLLLQALDAHEDLLRSAEEKAHLTESFAAECAKESEAKQMPYGDVLQATIGKRNREQTEKAAAKVGTTSSIAARVVALEPPKPGLCRGVRLPRQHTIMQYVDYSTKVRQSVSYCVNCDYKRKEPI